ncbi:methyl-accepting chemotaxis protein [Planktothricoides raciborskii]|uniref:CHASE3 domain-containing protein n=1 Tax=Planktothricoides raciborskii FACHB-1370 TaxID=2949576 RepID=A0ABR8EAP7_9CYAN|nr:methyl-accepting chemotaxis protein [Planktothricoides raciborskii]MBD2543696.1 CHASE3 domain-containing protein [Planktothricoides raciborskii FACHB-1370]MBD2582411.1 CHASE3 domain-containing protein [Planktothricoides raciborskii FACHB-1261]
MQIIPRNEIIKFTEDEKNLLTKNRQKNQWRLGKTIPIGLGIIASLNLFSAMISRTNILRIFDAIDWVNTAHEVKANIRLLDSQILELETDERGFLLTGNTQYLTQYEDYDESISKVISDLRLLIKDPNQLERLDDVETILKIRLSEIAATIQLKKNNETATVLKAVQDNTSKNTRNQIRIQLKKMEEEQHKIIGERQEIANQAEIQANLLTIATSTGIFMLVCGMIWFVLRQVIQPIDRAALTISSSSAQIAATVEEHERIANQQAASVNQTTTTMDELGASSRQAAGQAEAAAQNVDRLLILAIGSNKAENMTFQHEANLKEKSQQIAQQVLSLSEKLTQIDRIAGVVSQLANQTNMLALNAAVEAVRAGDQGKGFGVIATEIRKLADQSGKYAEQINGLTADIQLSTDATVSVSEEGKELVEKMVNSINEIALNIKQISFNANQQAIAIQQSVEAMTSINQGAAETATGIAQTKASTQQLNEAAQALKALV